MGRKTLSLFLCLFLAAPVFSDEIVVGGGRRAVVKIPSSYDPAVPTPLVILLHGFGGNGAGQDSYWAFTPLAEERGLLYAHPDGVVNNNGARFWNATDACCGPSALRVDDSEYLRGLIEEIESKLNVDADRIFFGGLSNGGFMSHRMACDHADKVAAIASQAGAVWADPALCEPSAGVHVLQIHGTSDSVIFFGGGTGANRYPGAIETVEQWAMHHNGCAGEPEMLDDRLDIVSGADFETTIRRYAEDCTREGSAELWTMIGGSHVPGLTRTGNTTNLAIHVVDWFLAHPKRPAPEVTAFAVTPESGVAPLAISASVADASAPEGTAIERYHWSFGDGSGAEGDTVSHTYTAPGRRTLALVAITDDSRVSTRVTRDITVLCPAGDVSPWTPAEIGEPAFPGAASPADDDTATSGSALRVCGGGSGLSGRSDAVFFTHREVGGDFRLTARLSELEGDPAQAGVMLRESLDADAAFVALLLEVTTVSNFRMRRRNASGSQARSSRGDAFESEGWARIERRGSVYSTFSSADGETWVPVGATELPDAPEVILAGIVVASPTRVFSEPSRALATEIAIEELVAGPRFVRGNTNGDDVVDISDASHLLNWLFLGGPEPPCEAAADVNGQNGIDISDASALLNFLFLGGAAPAAPFPECASSELESDVELGCDDSPCP